MTVYKRGTRWHYAFCIRGRRYRQAIPEARNKLQAERAESAAREAVFSGTYDKARAPITFGEFVAEHYLPLARETTRYFSTNAGYQTRILTEAFGVSLLADLSHFSIEKWLRTLRGEYSGATLNHFIRRLGTILNHARAAGFLEADHDPVRLVRRIEETPRAKRRLEVDEERRLLEAANLLGLEHVGQALILLLETGMRPRELFELRREQLDLAEGIVRPISYKIGRRTGGSAQPRERIVPITIRARAVFERLQAEALAAKRERLYPYRDIKKGWATVARAAGVAGFWLRWCRDEAASRWTEAGIDPFTVARLLGHAGPKTTMVYVRDFRDRTAALMERVATNLPQREGEGLRQVG